MTDALRPASPLRLGALSHLMAGAFTSSRGAAVVATPASLVSLLPSAMRGTLWEAPDGTGMVVFGRHRPALDLLLTIGLLMLGLAAGVAVLVLGASAGGPAGLLTALVVLVAVSVVIGAGALLLLAASAAALTSTVGRESPPGRRWSVMALAQRPGTRLSALLLARRLIARVPPGEVVVAVAGSPDLAAGYERLGFTRGRGARVHFVAPG